MFEPHDMGEHWSFRKTLGATSIHLQIIHLPAQSSIPFHPALKEFQFEDEG
jgi:hypothetical protein